MQRRYNTLNGVQILRKCVLAVCVVCMSLLLSTLASAHGVSHDLEKVPTLSPLPSALNGIRVQLINTLGPQILVDNPTTKTLLILGRDGQPFIRLSARGCEGNEAHRDWFDTYLPGGLPGKRARPHGTVAWKVFKSSPQWGWFDPRLKVIGNAQEWSIPVEINGVKSAISGRFVAATNTGYWQPQITQMPKLPVGASLMLIPGQPYGLMLSNPNSQEVMVLGRQQEVFLRASKGGVYASQASPLWNETAQQQGLRAVPEKQVARWLQLSTGSRITWVEPRTQPRVSVDLKQPFNWQIKLQIGTEVVAVNGQSRWVERH